MQQDFNDSGHNICGDFVVPNNSFNILVFYFFLYSDMLTSIKFHSKVQSYTWHGYRVYIAIKLISQFNEVINYVINVIE